MYVRQQQVGVGVAAQPLHAFLHAFERVEHLDFGCRFAQYGFQVERGGGFVFDNQGGHGFRVFCNGMRTVNSLSVSVTAIGWPVRSIQRLRRFSRPIPVPGSGWSLGALWFDTTSQSPSVRIEMRKGLLRVMVLCFTALSISGCNVSAGSRRSRCASSMAMSKKSLSA